MPHFLREASVVAGVDQQRARRYSVRWPVRVRSVGESVWRAGRVVDLSVTGVLFQLDNQYRVGAEVEIEIDFLTPDTASVVSGVGVVVREHPALKNAAAVQFQVECGFSASASARQARPAGSLK